MNTTLATRISTDLGLRTTQIAATIALFDDGATVPFIARYRKEHTGNLDETQIRQIADRMGFWRTLDERKATILASIAEQGFLNTELQKAIENCSEKQALEDLYLPYKPKRRTRASIAREKGLAPLLERILENPGQHDLTALALPYCNAELGVTAPEEALNGASDIFAEQCSENALLRSELRELFISKAHARSTVRKKFKDKGERSKFEQYYDYATPLRTIASHNLLAMLRGQREDILNVGIEIDEQAPIALVEQRHIPRSTGTVVRAFLAASCRDAYERLLFPSLETEVLSYKQQEAELEAIVVFAKNLREILLAAPAGPHAMVAVDPGFRTGCKIVALDGNGKFLATATIYPHEPQREVEKAKVVFNQFVSTYAPRYVAVGNGTAGRETAAFCKQALQSHSMDNKPDIVTVSEAGASVYSASPLAQQEFPTLDVTIRGAISIGRRLRDPLAELVKIDPKAIGVGQYQHDVDQKLLQEKLEQVVESCVNHVGVDVNAASAELLTYVSGFTKTVAANVIAYRDEHGSFDTREKLRKVPRLGAKTFEQAAGFLRIKGGPNPLDATGIHPESYAVVERLAKRLNMPVAALIQNDKALAAVQPQELVNESTGEATVLDVLAELKRPGRDPRDSFSYASFREDVTTMGDLKPGMQLEGVVTNVANFGAFVDIGVHQDGLIHVSQLADRFVKDPSEVVRPGQRVNVRVLDIDLALKRISLSMRSDSSITSAPPSKKEAPKSNQSTSLQDLAQKWSKRG